MDTTRSDIARSQHLSADELDAVAENAASSPADGGTVEMLVSRPAVDERVVLDAAEVGVGVGLIGDNYVARGSSSTPDGTAHPEAQLTLMNSRVIDGLSRGDRDRWPPAGDQLFVDLDLSTGNLPAGTRLAIGDAVIEVSQKPHNGCAKFADRYGMAAARWVNADKSARRRGLNAMVVRAGTVRSGDRITKLH